MIPTLWRTRSPKYIRSYPMLGLMDEISRLFDDTRTPESGYFEKGFNPPFDIKETEREYVLSGEFSGLEAKDINIEAKDNAITFSGEKRSENERKEGERAHIERYYGSFSRTINFDVEIDEDNISANMKNGVLTVTVPKSEKIIKGAKKISIKNQ